MRRHFRQAHRAKAIVVVYTLHIVCGAVEWCQATMAQDEYCPPGA
ncbi:MAG: hypothetical protein ACYDBA_13665 [Sulfuricaulis sp.]